MSFKISNYDLLDQRLSISPLSDRKLELQSKFCMHLQCLDPVQLGPTCMNLQFRTCALDKSLRLVFEAGCKDLRMDPMIQHHDERATERLVFSVSGAGLEQACCED